MSFCPADLENGGLENAVEQYHAIAKDEKSNKIIAQFEILNVFFLNFFL